VTGVVNKKTGNHKSACSNLPAQCL